MSRKVAKKTIDIPADLFDKIMQYAYENKIYKFSPTVIELLEFALKQKETEDK